MTDVITILKESTLFSGIREEEIEKILLCLSAERRTWEGGETIIQSGAQIKKLGVVLLGRLRIEKSDYWGNRSILSFVTAGEIFGEVYACMEPCAVSVHVMAAEKTEVLFLDVSGLTSVCASACGFHSRIVRNLLAAMAEKTYFLTRKIEYLSKRTIREKLLSYLSEQAQLAGKEHFTIPFSRQELADYLCSDRSALSKELGKMQREGILEFHRNTFYLKAMNEKLDW